MSSPFTPDSDPNRNRKDGSTEEQNASQSHADSHTGSHVGGHPNATEGEGAAPFQSPSSRANTERPATGSTPASPAGAGNHAGNQQPPTQPGQDFRQPGNQNFTQPNPQGSPWQNRGQQSAPANQAWSPTTGANHAYPGAPAQNRQAPTSEGNSLNIVGLVGVGVAVLGLVLGFFKSTFIFGWILFFAAVILTVVSFFMRGKEKKSSGVATILSILLVILLSITSVRVLATALGGMDKHSSDYDSDYSSSDSYDFDEDESASPSEEPDPNRKGSRNNPYDFATEIKNKEWTVKVNSFEPNANEKVRDRVHYYKEPMRGQNYGLVNATLTYNGEDVGRPSSIKFAFVNTKGNTFSFTPYVDKDPLLDEEMYKGASVTGDMYMSVPTEAKGLIRIQAGFTDEPVFMKIPE
ncbi:hypothetical protein [Winkia neuii]|uniref:hypothetical protein n=1 Tax=Winkia neuii TaxID=33007 RepID=UPI002555419F|nr:hypothetical protein [Winkia neuii]MDK8100498.1 hypothetical protein [Winkia neuii]